MADRAFLIHAEPGIVLPFWEHLAPPPPPSLITARIEAASAPGDIVLDPFGRGGWIARAAIDSQRRAITLESTPLDRLLAEVVLRPPDLRHLDAALQSLGASARRDSSLKAWIARRYGTRCATCGRPVVADEFTWTMETDDAGANAKPTARPVTKHYRCGVCKAQIGGSEKREAPLDAADLERVSEPDDAAARPLLRERFAPPSDTAVLPDELLDLHTPRQLAALSAILGRVEGDMRAEPIEAALRLALLHAVAPASRLGGTGGRVAALRIASGHVKPPTGATWRERNPWAAFEDGVRAVRGLIQRLESGIWGPVPARLGQDLRSLHEGAATAVLRQDNAAGLGAINLELEYLAERNLRPRVSLVLGTLPQMGSQERLAWTFHGTAWALGRLATATLPVDMLYGTPFKLTRSRQVAAVARSLRGVQSALARDARTVVLLDDEAPESLVAAALGGVAAGYRLVGARTAEAAGPAGGSVEMAPPGSGNVPGGPRTRANVVLPPLPGGAGDPDVVRSDRLFSAPQHVVDAPFSEDEAARAVVDAAVEVLKLRGEPVSLGGMLGEIVVALDRTGHLRRFVKPEAGAGAGAGAGPGATGGAAQAADAIATAGAADGMVEALLALVTTALDGALSRRLTKLDDDRWWLFQRTDREAASVPLADRVEWAAYSLLSAGGPLSEAAFLERITGLFTGLDQPDAALVQACLDSYRSSASTAERLATSDDLVSRSAQHSALIALLVETGHRLGFRCWIGGRQQGRRHARATLGDLLDDGERNQPPGFSRIRGEDLEDVDVAWYVRGKALLLWEVEWTAMLGEPILRRHAGIPEDERVVRFLVTLPERTELVRHKLERSPLLRAEFARAGWHVFKADHLRAWAGGHSPSLDELEPLLGLDPPIERNDNQLPLFSG
jgi:hypothetical protein